MTQEHKDKIRKALIGNKNTFGHILSFEHKRKIGIANSQSLKGRTLSEQHKVNISIGGIGRKSPSGENHFKWIKDRTQLKKSENKNEDSAYYDWRKRVYARDSWKCKINNQDCNGRIEAHHILSWRDYKELRYDINNGITLCHFHHPIKKSEEVKLSPYFMELIK